MKYYRLKNPITKNYFCQSADQVEEQSLNEAIVYDEATVNTILHDANVIGGIYLANYGSQLNNEKFEKSKKQFPGYELEEVNLLDMPLPKEWDIKINQYAAKHNISYDNAKLKLTKQMIKSWCAWAIFNPFGGKPYPTEKNPFLD